jgi:hypothetical protein
VGQSLLLSNLMNPYQWPVTCSICGEEGVGTYRTAGEAWISGSIIFHKDPRVCRENIEARERREKAKHDKQPEYSI